MWRLLVFLDAVFHIVWTANWKAFLRRPLVFPPLVLLSILVAQHFSQFAVGESGDRLSSWAYVVFAAIVPLALLVAGFFSFRLQLRASAPNPDARVAQWNMRLEAAAICLTGFVVIAAILVELVRLKNSVRWLDQNGGSAAIAFDVAMLAWIVGFALHGLRRLRRVLWPREGSEYRTIFNAVEAFISTAALSFIVASALAYYAGVDYDPSSTIATGDSVNVTVARWTSDTEIAIRFAPRLVLDRDERWPAISIDSLMDAKQGIVVHNTDSSTTRIGPATGLATVRTRPLHCRSAAPCYQVDLRPFAEQDCRPGREEPADLPRCPKAPTVYARILRRGRDPQSFPSEGRRDQRISAVVEYWLFYGYDRWERRTPVGLLRQQHDGDWEAVLVGLRGHEPAWVAYTSHCGGVVKKWADVHVDAEGHPYAFVAEGSHANYPTSGPQTPDWLGCARTKHSGGDIALVNAFSNIREQVDARGSGKIPAVLLADDEPLLREPFWWGTVDATTLSPLARPAVNLAGGTGPESPGCKALWRQPLGNIYCDKRWDTSDIVHRSTDQFCSRWKTTGLDCGAA
jgi:hypothetical protein